MSRITDRQRDAFVLGLNLLIILLEVVGVVIACISWGWNMLIYYTQESNIFALVVCAVYTVFHIIKMKNGTPIPEAVKVLKYIASCCLTVTFVVTVTVLCPIQVMTEGNIGKVYFDMLLKGSVLYHHFLCPLLLFFAFMFVESDGKLDFRSTIFALVPTLLYALIVIPLNVAKVITGPYPFLHVYEQPVVLSVVWFIVIDGGAYGFAVLYRMMKNRITKKQSRT